MFGAEIGGIGDSKPRNETGATITKPEGTPKDGSWRYGPRYGHTSGMYETRLPPSELRSQ
jgi:hypothetical protein